MSASKKFQAPVPGKPPVTVAVVELADGRIVARTAEELETLAPEDQAAVAEALGLPAPGRVQS